MTSTVCTLIEGDYHYGVAALANSLFANGYRGEIFAGYKGELPAWASDAVASAAGTLDLRVAAGLNLRFLRIDAHGHLTNLKPYFMIEVWKRHSPEAQALFYFDPDIVVRCRWSFFEEWILAGVALCADVNWVMPAGHPIRFAWKKFFGTRGLLARRELEIYFNGGFIGVHRSNQEFLTLWKQLTDVAAGEIGGLLRTNIGERTYLFCKTDQDFLNFAAMASTQEISAVGQ